MLTCLNCNESKKLSAFEKLESGNIRKTCRNKEEDIIECFNWKNLRKFRKKR